MKYLKAGILSLLLFFTVVSVSYAMELSLNNSGFSPEKTLILTLNEDWSGEADVYIAVTLPGSDKFFYLTPQNTFSLNKVLYAQKIQAKGSKEILRMVLPANLPAGEYTFYAMAMRSSVNTIIG